MIKLTLPTISQGVHLSISSQTSGLLSMSTDHDSIYLELRLSRHPDVRSFLLFFFNFGRNSIRFHSQQYDMSLVCLAQTGVKWVLVTASVHVPQQVEFHSWEWKMKICVVVPVIRKWPMKLISISHYSPPFFLLSEWMTLVALVWSACWHKGAILTILTIGQQTNKILTHFHSYLAQYWSIVGSYLQYMVLKKSQS